jgi:CHAP domain
MTKELIAQLIVEEAKKYVGVTEHGGENRGPEVERFQRAVDGKARGEPWCMAFVQFVTGEVCRRLGVRNPLPQSEHCLTVFYSTVSAYRSEKGSPGFVAIWQHGKTSAGHTGFVTEPGVVYFRTIEGNTNSAGSREGDGVYEKKRLMLSGARLSLRGFIDLPQLIFDAGAVS